ncbi:hypothetical protein V5799_030920 [Amblyomma americanum]|uniref:Peptidase M13 N-terminal domain-containing protein n=1 Tax=Amblyomma americanum TaxID=6943 RepID=A0AAQ4ELT0_AMBAM
MVSLNLDLLNLDTIPLVDPVDMMVRLAIDIGVAPVFDFWFFDDTFHERKRAMKFKISDFQEAWHKKREELKKQSPDKLSEYFSDQLRLYPGYDAQKSADFATKLRTFDEALVTAINKHVKPNTVFIIRVIEDMGKQTAPKIMPEKWAHMVANYTKGMYGGGAFIHVQKELLNALKELLEASDWGDRGFTTTLAWRLFDALSEYVQPAKLVGGKDKQEVCYDHVQEVMQFAMASHYLRPRVSLDTIRKAEEMFSNVREAFIAALKSSSWLKGTVFEYRPPDRGQDECPRRQSRQDSRRILRERALCFLPGHGTERGVLGRMAQSPIGEGTGEVVRPDTHSLQHEQSEPLLRGRKSRRDRSGGRTAARFLRP